MKFLQIVLQKFISLQWLGMVRGQPPFCGSLQSCLFGNTAMHYSAPILSFLLTHTNLFHNLINKYCHHTFCFWIFANMWIALSLFCEIKINFFQVHSFFSKLRNWNQSFHFLSYLIFQGCRVWISYRAFLRCDAQASLEDTHSFHPIQVRSNIWHSDLILFTLLTDMFTFVFSG